ncbi:MAG: peptidoglycan DD-metalloendopeptidase family protein [Nitrospirota bacterium]|nr:peptidoglycan DD-metalloendopeptidase family protein [Nitrospirota bacterium]
MKKIYIACIIVLIAFITLRSNFSIINKVDNGKNTPQSVQTSGYREIAGNIQTGETLFDIFRKYKLDVNELFKMREASADLHRLRDLYPNRPYKIVLDEREQINSFTYWINDDTILSIRNTNEGFCAEKIAVQYEKRIEYIGGTIKDNLSASLENENGGLLLALQLSDIFAWDIDFTTDIRKNDAYKIAVEGFYLDGKFRKYGDIIAAEFINNGETFLAYRYEIDGKADYYNEEGKSMRKALLKAPLNYRRISSFFSKGRKHPILKIYRPHRGVDYAAPGGTPVSVAGDGKVVFAGNKGQYGKLVIVKHRNGYKTYYGHLSRIAKGIRTGRHAEQGQIIGYVGSTGLATGPHLHYEMRVNDKPVNPLSIKIPRGKSVPGKMMADFIQLKKEVNTQFALNKSTSFALARNSTLPDSK